MAPFNSFKIDFETKHFMSFDKSQDFSDTQDCRATISPITVIGADHDHWILGQNFLSNYFSIFDLDEKRIGLLDFS